MDFAIILTRDDEGRVVVSFPDIPEARAVGEYEGDALVRAEQALTAAMAACIRDRRPIPRASHPGRRRISVPALVEIKLGIYDAMREAQLGRAELARRLGWHRPQVDRLLNLRHASRLDQLEAALAVLGKRLVVTVDTADR